MSTLVPFGNNFIVGVTLYAIMELANGEYLAHFNVHQVDPPIPSRSGSKTIRLRFKDLETMAEALRIDQNRALESVPGTKYNLAMKVEQTNGRLAISEISVVGRVFMMRVHDDSNDKSDKAPEPAISDEKKEPKIDCAFCNDGKSLDIGATCEYCLRVRVGEDEIIISDRANDE